MIVKLRILTLFLCASLSLAVQAGQYSTKADYIVKFTRYTTWPSSSGDIDICVVKPNPFGSELTQRAKGKTAKKRKLEIKYISQNANPDGCEIIFISKKISSSNTQSMISRAGKGTLTIGESPGFLSKGGMLEFFSKGKRVRFRISNANAKKAGIRLSAQLQKLAGK
jgi:hypothetical protein